jgi:uncharacterized protein (DUF1684 family)
MTGIAKTTISLNDMNNTNEATKGVIASHAGIRPVATDSYVQQWHMWHEQRLEELKAPHGYLAPVSITWIANGSSKTIDGIPGVWKAEDDVLTYYPDLTAGRKADNGQIEDSRIHESRTDGSDAENRRNASRLVSDRKDDRYERNQANGDRRSADHCETGQSETWVRNAGAAVKTPISFVPTAFGEEALGYVRYGDIRLEVNSQTDLIHQDTHRFWVRVKDPNTRVRQDFNDIGCFPIERRWRIAATFRRAEHDELDIHDSVVTTVLQSYPVVGFVEFTYDGVDYSLVVSNVFGHASIFFSDETTDKETYGIGRVLQLDALTLDSLNALDFNYAYNYPCAFSAYCTCPIPSKRNHLPFAVTAGEKTPNVRIGY